MIWIGRSDQNQSYPILQSKFSSTDRGDDGFSQGFVLNLRQQKQDRNIDRSMAATHVLHSFWRRHRWTVLRSLLLVALLHRLHLLAFLAASSPVWLLTAFLLGAVLVNSEPNVPLAVAAALEDHEGRHLTTAGTGPSSSSSSSDDGANESEEDVDEDHLVVDKKEAVAWTADDEHSIQSIGSLELERNARLEKLMSRITVHRGLTDLDVHTPAVLAPRTKNPFDLDLDHDAAMDAPGSAPSSLLGQHTNPFDIHIQQPDEVEEEDDDKKAAMLVGRHDSFTAQPSRFMPYFVADVPEEEGGGGSGRDAGSDNSNSNSSSPSASTASDHQTQQEAAVKVEEAPAAMASTWDGKENGTVVAVDVELISDSSDDDMSLQADDATGGSLNNAHDPSDEDEEDSFEVESITQQVAAGTCSAFWFRRSLSHCLLRMQLYPKK